MSFHFFDHLPKEIKQKFAEDLSLRDRIRLYNTSTSSRQLIQDDPFWKELGAKNYTDFQSRVRKLSKPSRESVYNEYISLRTAEILKLKKPEERLNQLPVEEQEKFRSAFSERELAKMFGDTLTVRLIFEKVISVEQLAELDNKKKLGSRYEREKETENQAELMRSIQSGYAMLALRKGLITFADVLAMPNDNVHFLFNHKYGVVILQEKLMTPKELGELKSVTVAQLSMNEGAVVALREKLITHAEIKVIENDNKSVVDEISNRVQAFKGRAQEIKPK